MTRKFLKSAFILMAIIMMSLSSYAYNGGNKLPINDNSDITLIQKEIECINQQFTPEVQSRTFKDWCNIGVADLSGAWVGSWAGGKVGGLFGPQGAAIGAVAGGVIVGAAASYGASRHAAPGVDHALLDSKIKNLDANTVYPNPNNNPFDQSVGQRHNQILKLLVTTNPTAGPSAPEKMFAKASLTNNETIFYNNQKSVVLDFYNKAKSSPTKEAFKSLLAQNIEDQTLLTVMNGYIDGVMNSSTFENAIKISLEYETYVLENRNLTQEQKDLLLHGFAVARYSLNFWNQAHR
jgi:hypothetical protein